MASEQPQAPRPVLRPRPAHARPWCGTEVAASFATSRHIPWTVAYTGLEAASGHSTSLRVDGNIPEGIQGTLYRNGPGRHERAGERYAHRWDGDGLVQAFAIQDGRVTHLARFVQTRKIQQEDQAGRFLCNAFGSYRPGSSPIPTDIDDWNTANINVIRCGDELLALWEGGSAYRLDPSTLRTWGVKRWGEFQGRAFSAHPRREPDGTVWNFGCEPLSGLLNVYRIDADGGLRSAQQVHIPGRLPNIHDFAVTDRHLVFLLSPMPINESKLRAGASFAQACEWRPELGTRVLVMDKADLRQRWYELPPFCVFHISNACVRVDDTIELEFVAARTPLSLMAGWSVMAGQYTHREGGLLFKLELRSDGTVGLEDFGGLEGEFPTIRASRVGRAHGQLLMPTRSSTRDRSVPGFDTLSLVDVTSGGVVSYSFGSDWQVEEHHFIGEHAVDGADDRWIIGTALNVRSALTALVVFDAADLAAGPVAKAWMDQAMPLGLHGTFVPRLCQK